MPYITEEDRRNVSLTQRPGSPGELNYMITLLCKNYLYQHGISYTNMNEIVGVLECAKMELYRRVAVPYEEEKCKINGDVYDDT
jgi:hypothetical protein|tara:strand:- start:340 stop:591 length:252 start_codon:yes stop_codon:yes gene_type:complete